MKSKLPKLLQNFR